MAHAIKANAGQKYGSARKQGVAGEALKILRAGIENRHRKGTVDAEEQERVLKNILHKNALSAKPSSDYYRY